MYISCIDPLEPHYRPLSSVPHSASLPEPHMRQAMPPRSSLTSSFSASTDVNNEVVCPLSNPDGSHCRKRCLGVSASCPRSRSRSRSCPVLQCNAMLCRAVGMQASFDEFGGNKPTVHHTGEALSIDARTYTKSTFRALYTQASSDRGKLPADDQLPSFRATSSPAAAKFRL